MDGWEDQKASKAGCDTSTNGKSPNQVMVVTSPQMEGMFPQKVFRDLDCELMVANSVTDAKAISQDHALNVVVLPLHVGTRNTLWLIQELRKQSEKLSIIVISQSDQINDAAEAMRLGAIDCIFLPFTEQRLKKTLGSALSRVNRQIKVANVEKPCQANTHSKPSTRSATKQSDRTTARHGMVLSDISLRPILQTLEKMSDSHAPVLIQGKTGTGKEILARAIHAESPRANGPFVVVDCANLTPETLNSQLSAALSHKTGGASAAEHGATLFLDEITRTNVEVQKHLLRFLDHNAASGTDNADPATSALRIICSTTENVSDQLRTGRLREDLYYRLNVIPITLPALRERGTDILAIAETKLLQIARENGRRFRAFTPEAAARLATHSWPGNIRQLINVIRNIVLHHDGDLVTIDMLPTDLLAGNTTGEPAVSQLVERISPSLLGRPLAEIERIIIEETIHLHGGSVPRAAHVLDVSPSTIYRKREVWLRK